MFYLKSSAVFATVCLIAVMVGCGGGNSKSIIVPTVQVSISPTSATVSSGGTQSFTATVQNAADTNVIWQVNQVTGGSSTTGIISSTGMYTAPSVQSQTVFTVTAVAEANTGIIAAASVTVTPLVSVSVSPQSASVQTNQQQQFTATVINTTNTAVTWEVNGTVGGNIATVGSISASGLYTAPNSVPAQNPVTVTAISVADPTKSNSASVTVTPAPIITVNVSPTQANVVVGNSQSFTATVTGTSNTAVTWKVNGVTGGNATVGTISTSGLYTAPASVPNPATVTVTAVSQADTTKSGSATVTVFAVLGVSISPPGPLHVALSAQQMFTATVTGDPLNQGVTWNLTCFSDAESSAFADCAAGGPIGDDAADISSLINMSTSSVTLQAGAGEGQVGTCDEGSSCVLTLTATTVATDSNSNPATATVTITIP